MHSVQAQQGKCATDGVHQRESGNTTGNPERDCRHDQQWETPVGKDGHHHQVNQDQRNQVVARERSLGSLELITRPGYIHTDAGRYGATVPQVSEHVFAHNGDPGLERYGFGRNDTQGHGAPTIHAPHGTGIDCFDHARDTRQGHHSPAAGINRQIREPLGREAGSCLAIEIHVDLVISQEKFIDKSTVGEGRDGKADIAGIHTQFRGPLPVRVDFD